MAAQYPDSIRAFPRRADRVDVNAAEDINALQDEVDAIEATLGRNPHTSATYPASTVSQRLALLEQDIVPRLTALEKRMRRASVAVRRASALQVNSSPSWQNLVLPDVASTINDFDAAVYTEDGRFFSVAPSPGLWAMSASITFQAADPAVGLRGLRVVTSGGTVLASTIGAGQQGEEQTVSVQWTGRLSADPAFYLRLQVRHTQGTALYLRADSATTPLRADFTHIPG